MPQEGKSGPAHERRRIQRQSIKEVAVVCYAAEFTGKVTEQYNVATHLVDVSPMGACLVTVGRMRPGIEMILDLSFPQTGDHLKAKTQVRWSESVKWRGRDVNLTGLEFIRILNATGNAITTLQGRRPSTARVPVAGDTPSQDPRRAARRFPVEVAEAACFPKSLLAFVGVNNNTAQGVVNLSLGGCQLVCTRKLTPGKRVKVVIRLKSFGDLIQGQAEVRWCRLDTVSWNPRWLAGIIFKEITPESKRVLKTLSRWYDQQLGRG